MQRISGLTDELLTSQEGLCSMEFVSCILKKDEVSSAEIWANIYWQAGMRHILEDLNVHDYCTKKL